MMQTVTTFALMAKKKKMGADFDEEFLDGWNRWAKSCGYQQGRAARGGLEVLRLLPVELRLAVIAGHFAAVEAWLQAAEKAVPPEPLLVRHGVYEALGRKPKRPPEPPAGRPGKGDADG